MLLTGSETVAQIRQPLVSPYATVSEEVGLTEITIKYARPAVNGREIWGALVPYGVAPALVNFGNGKDFPWRAGANRTTTISFEHDVLIEGQPLEAGTYGIHMIPSEADWTVIFNESPKWGSFFYDEADDALRVTVTPEEAPFKERLAYEFMDQNNQGALTIALLWADKKVPFGVEVARYHDVVLAEMEDELFHRGGFTWQNYTTLANYSLTNNVDLGKGRVWADRAITANPTFFTQSLNGRFLLREGKFGEAEAYMAPLIEASTENELNLYGYQVMFMGMTDRALDIFKLNVERHPDSWNPYDSLAECYNNLGDTDSADKYYRIALEKLPENDQANRDRIERILGGLGG
jgi:tetratricopeptide (TPR) repeat protein